MPSQELLLHVFCTVDDEMKALDLTRLRRRGHEPTLSDNDAPRPEAEVSGRPPRGGRLREVAPVGGREVIQTQATPQSSAEAPPGMTFEMPEPACFPEEARRIARSSLGPRPEAVAS